jgi:thiol-disulfide isomerase/thioredoxin
MVKSTLFVVIAFATSTFSFFANTGKKAQLKWQSPVEVEARYLAEKRPILVDVYTSWCQYCKLMDATTWKNDSVVEYINSRFYAVKFNAESRDSVSWFGKTFVYKSNYKVNTLAIDLLQGNMVYPSTVIIPTDGEPVILKGAIKAQELEQYLKFFGEKASNLDNWEAFNKNFSSTW